MSEGEGGVSRERLKELSKTTASYGLFSHQLSGLPLSAFGAWGLLALVQSWAATPDRTHLLLTPVLWAVLTPIHARLYQSDGVVVPRFHIHMWWLGGIATAMSATVLLGSVLHSTWYLGAVSKGWAMTATILVLAGVIGYAVRVERATDYVLLWSLWIAADAARDHPWFTDEGRFASACVWGGLGVGGIAMHLQFRRLKLRMAALRGEGT